MFPDDIRIGTRLELEIFEDDERVGEPYVSQILEYQEDGNIVISTPIYEARLIFIPENTLLRLSFTHKKVGLLGFTATAIKHDNKDNLSVLVVKPTSELFKLQRRANYRLDYTTNVLIKINQHHNLSKPAQVIKAHTKNISGSGLCVISDIELPKGTDVTVELHLSKAQRITAKCHVVRSESIVIRKVKSYYLGMHYYDITKQDQERLIRFIFEQQRLLLKRGLY